MMYWESFSDTVTKVREQVRFPERKRTRHPRTSPPDPTKPVLVRGRGLARRRRQAPVRSLFYVLLVVAFLYVLLQFLG